MSKQTNELVVFLGKGVNAGHRDAADGQLNPINDFAEYIPFLLAGQPGLTGLGEIGQEQTEATIEAQEATKQALLNELGDLKPLDAYNITEGTMGLLNWYSFIKRKAYEKGLEDGRTQLATELKSGARSIEEL
ncbi:MAG: hypothetical protein AAFP77_16165 [Bacteroidota bacterium]